MKRTLIILILLTVLIVSVHADTTIYNPVEDATLKETSTGTWTTIRNDTGDDIDRTGSLLYTTLRSYDSGNYYYINRLAFDFDTSNLTGKTVNSAIFSIYILQKDNQLGSPAYSFTEFTPTYSNGTLLVKTDYSRFFGTDVTSRINYADIAQSAYNNWTVTNLSTIKTTGITEVMLRDAWDIDFNTSGPTWTTGNVQTYVRAYMVEDATRKPKLYVTWTAGGGGSAPVASFTTTKTLYRMPGILQVNDTSTNTPTIWNWSWGDGTWTNGTMVTQQNATHKYTTRGKFAVTLLCSNANGANTTPTAQNIRIVGYENLW